MRAVVQKVSEAFVTVEDIEVGRIESGFMALLGVGDDDDENDALYIADKIAKLRVFEDEEGKLNKTIFDCGGSVLAISQFTLYGDTRKGSRPSFSHAAPPEKGKMLFEKTVDFLKERGLKVETGVFRAHMKVHLVNDGPVTILLDSKKIF